MKFDPERGRKSSKRKSELWQPTSLRKRDRHIRGKNPSVGVLPLSASADVTRRAAGLGSLAGLVTAFTMGATQRAGGEPSIADRVSDVFSDLVGEAQVERNELETFEMELDFSELSGQNVRVRNIYAFLLGLEEGSVIPERVTIKPLEVFNKLCDKKEEFIRERHRRGVFSDVEEAQYLRNVEQLREHGIQSMRERLLETKKFPSVDAFVEHIAPIPNQVHSAIHWNEVGRRMRLDEGELEFVKQASAKIDARMLTAYAMTELFPGQIRLSMRMFTQYLKNGGIHLLEVMPAIYDRYICLGLAQFTSYAVQDGAGELNGASIINRAVNTDAQRIPGSALYIDTYEKQFRAMYLFAIHNLAQASKRLSTEQRARLLQERDKPVFKELLLEYIAGAHHKPAHAVSALDSYTAEDLSEGRELSTRTSSLEDYMEESLAYYRAITRRG